MNAAFAALSSIGEFLVRTQMRFANFAIFAV